MAGSCVQVDGADFGQAMVVKDHTAVYDGRNDANPAYVAELRAADVNGRTCDQPGPPPPSRVDAPPAPDYSDSDRDTRRRTGNSGHPCLPGERDGDNDGYCEESGGSHSTSSAACILILTVTGMAEPSRNATPGSRAGCGIPTTSPRATTRRPPGAELREVGRQLL